jgi:predicted DNA-binding ribbon-helix-helix protein
MKYREIGIAGRTVSIGLEEEFWDCLEEIASASNVSAENLLTQVAEQHPNGVESALRVFALSYVLARASVSELTTGFPACERASKYH